MLKGQPLLPRLNSLVARDAWTDSPGGQLIIAQLLRGVTPKISITFKCAPEPDYLYTYLAALQTQPDALRDLEFRITWPNAKSRVTASSAQAISYKASLPLFAEMTSLQRLFLDPSMVTFTLLNVIGDLPHLKDLTLGDGSDRSRVTPTDAQYVKWEGKFPSLLNLQMRTELFHLTPFFTTVFKGLHERSVALSHLTIIAEDTAPLFGKFKCLANLPKSTEQITFDYTSHVTAPIESMHFRELGAYSDLHEIHIHHYKYVQINSASMKELLTAWPRLTALTLECKVPNDVETWPAFITSRLGTHSPGIDLSILGVLAIHAPKLESLHLSVFACKSHFLDRESDSNPGFQRLRTFKLSNSMLNYQRHDFQWKEAASFVSVLIGSQARFIADPLVYKGTEKVTQDHVRGYNEFMEGFVAQVNDYTKEKEKWTRRLLTGVEQVSDRLARTSFS